LPKPDPGQRERQIVKASFNLPAGELDRLRALAATRNITVTQALRQAIATECFLAEQPTGSRVLLQNPGERSAREVVFRG
jgi:hypothetical protein